PDLREMMQTGSSRTVSAILQVDEQNAQLHQLLRDNGVRISQRLTGVLAVELPLNAVQKLADSGLVAHISRDRKVTSFGHVSQESGTDVARAATYSTVNSLDGSGIGIAIVDSGIDSGHVEF